MPLKIDLNSDLGEHPNTDLDEQIMPYISSCNIACGGHIGDENSVRRTIELASVNNVAIGAHPSFPDIENFGRVVMDMNEQELKRSLRKQILLVKSVAEEVGVVMHHVKPHGALYNHAAMDEATSKMFCQLFLEIDPTIRLYGLAHSMLENVAIETGVNFIAEAFADRRYEMDRSLRSRSEERSVLTDEEEVLQQVESLACRGQVKSDEWILIKAQTICLHSDTKGSVHLAKAIRNHLEKKGVHIAAI